MRGRAAYLGRYRDPCRVWLVKCLLLLLLWRGRSACVFALVLEVVQVQGVLLTSGSVLKGPGSIFLRALRAQ